MQGTESQSEVTFNNCYFIKKLSCRREAARYIL